MKKRAVYVLILALFMCAVSCWNDDDDADVGGISANTVEFTLDGHDFTFTAGDGEIATPFGCHYTSADSGDMLNSTLVVAKFAEDTSVNLYFIWSGNDGDFTASNFKVRMFQKTSFTLIPTNPIDISVPDFGVAGDQISGGFSGSLKCDQDGADYPIEGEFSVTRVPDDSYEL